MRLSKEDVYLVERFGMTREAIARVLHNHTCIVTDECREIIKHADYYINPTDYCDGEYLTNLFPFWENKDDDDDGYPLLHEYGKESQATVFKGLISRGTRYGGMGSACEAVNMVDEYLEGKGL